MKEYLLHIETATTNCSVAVSLDGALLYCKESNAPDFRHSDYLHLFIEAALKEAGVAIQSLAGVGVSMGPGSYTGLRIGVSSAKGICYANDIPLVAVNSLEVLAQQAKVDKGVHILPMIDARRMEVFTMTLDQDHNIVLPTSSKIITPDWIEDLPAGKKVIIGSGAEKCKAILVGDDFDYQTEIVVPSARDMVSLVTKKFEEKQWEDVAYFEPFYLKDFYSNTAKSN
ncbi:MAG: tRNA (adenosine(37)-N6)-threonylcarbamoyltransferase complex dimerization subunit type 1 TsaB [Candidatus Arcticimaribacter sp.]